MRGKVLLVGAGPMAIEYVKVLKKFDKEVIVVGRGKQSARNFKDTTGIDVFLGGISRWVRENKDLPAYAIVAVTENELGSATDLLIRRRVKSILVEKPGGFSFNQIKNISVSAKECGVKVFVGYNRRFYASVLKAQEIIAEDKGVISFNFEFTEWDHVVKKLKKKKGIKEKWFLHNSTHIVDLAFFLGGWPRQINCYTAGGLSWHRSASIFAGSGVSKSGALFTYSANWQSPGRWGVEILTKKHRLILRPLEKLQIQNIGSVAVSFVEINDQLDLDYKPGLYKEIEAFLHGSKNLCTIFEQVKNLEFFRKISGYKP